MEGGSGLCMLLVDECIQRPTPGKEVQRKILHKERKGSV